MLMYAVRTKVGWHNFLTGDTLTLEPSCLSKNKTKAASAAGMRGCPLVTFAVEEVQRVDVEPRTGLPIMELKR